MRRTISERCPICGDGMRAVEIDDGVPEGWLGESVTAASPSARVVGATCVHGPAPREVER